MYGAEAVIPTKIKVPAIRLVLTEDQNTSNRAINLVLIEETIDKVLRRMIE